MSKTVISVEHLTKRYDLGVIGTGTVSRDLNRWWARMRGQPDPYLKIGQADHGNRQGESILALDDVSFTVEQGEVLGIIGRNGAGKSTLLKILSQVTAPTSGVVKVKGRIGSLLEVGTGFHPELTGRENVYLNGAILGMSRTEVDRKFDEIVDFSGVEKFIDTPVKRYSSGMYVRLAFAVAAHLEPEILIVDEVLAVGDAEFQKKCLGKMGDIAEEGRTVLFVSHNMAAVRNLCNKGLLIENGKREFFSNISEVIDEYFSNISHHAGKKVSNGNILYSDRKNNATLAISAVEILDKNFKKKDKIYTWDTFNFRIDYYSKSHINNGSLVLQITDLLGNRLILLSTRPDSNVELKVKKGDSVAYCRIEDFPLPAGRYWLGCGIAIPNNEWLFWDEKLTVLEVYPKDVLNSGLIPTNTRYLLLPKHEWKV